MNSSELRIKVSDHTCLINQQAVKPELSLNKSSNQDGAALHNEPLIEFSRRALYITNKRTGA